MDCTLAKMWRRMNNMIRRDTVYSVQLKPLRVPVLFGTDPVKNLDNVSAGLPWYTRADAGVQEWSVSAVGCAERRGDLRNGVALIGMITDDQTPVGESSDVYVTHYGNRASVICNTAANTMAVSLSDSCPLTVAFPGGATLKDDLKVEGNINATGDVADKTGTLQSVRDTFNEHDHPENGDGGGTTNLPNQKI